MEIIVAVTLIIGIATMVMVLRGWVLSILWGWFVVPAFGLPALSIPIAIGIALIASYLTHEGAEDNGSTAHKAGVAFGTPLMALVLGWIVQMFI